MDYYSLETSYSGLDGGSGGGSSQLNYTSVVNGGNATQPKTYWNGSSYIEGGKNGMPTVAIGPSQSPESSGGGGLGNISSNRGNGNSGVSINITGQPQFYAAGGGAGKIGSSTELPLTLLSDPTFMKNNINVGGSSIGGNGAVFNDSATIFYRYATSGMNGTGSGGGGLAIKKFDYLLPGNGGSGIVIIKYKFKTSSIEFCRGILGDNNVKYSIGNYDQDFKIISSVSGTSKEIFSIDSSRVVDVDGFVRSSFVAFHAVSSQLTSSNSNGLQSSDGWVISGYRTVSNKFTVLAEDRITGNINAGWDIILIDNSSWDPQTGIFTVKVKGIYMVLCTCIAMKYMQGFSIRLNASSYLDGINYRSAIFTGANIDPYDTLNNAFSEGHQISAQAIIHASIGDVISVWANSEGIVTNSTNLYACSSISIYLIMPT